MLQDNLLPITRDHDNVALQPEKTLPQSEYATHNQDCVQADELGEILSQAENATHNQDPEEGANSKVIHVISFIMHGLL